MVIVECPSCKQEVDLGSLPKGRESETYGCPHCDQELDWTDQDEFERINTAAIGLLALTENQMLFSTLLNLGIVRKISNFLYSLGILRLGGNFQVPLK